MSEAKKAGGGQKGRAAAYDFSVFPAARVAAIACAAVVVAFFLATAIPDSQEAGKTVAYVLLIAALVVLIFLCLNPDTVRSQHAEETLSVVSSMLSDIKGGLDYESASLVCSRILPETRAMAVAITDTEKVLACEGTLADTFKPGSPIRTTATRYVLKHGLVQSFDHLNEIPMPENARGVTPAAIIAPIKVGSRTIGALKFYYPSDRMVNRTQYALASGFAEVLSTQLNIHALELQKELTARAELRALQAQINPHFLFNTLNTIASLTRTEPLRARELLREFSKFYRATLENSGGLIPMSRELDQVQRYLVFERARFGEDRIETTYNISPGSEDVLVPAFVIQPLVENCVRHAMRDEGTLHIEVDVSLDGEEALLIEVSDDGNGMEPEVAARLFAEREDDPDYSTPQGSGAGIAMHNIFERIQRFYGPKSYTNVESEPGVGTSVFLHLDLLAPGDIQE